MRGKGGRAGHARPLQTLGNIVGARHASPDGENTVQIRSAQRAVFTKKNQAKITPLCVVRDQERLCAIKQMSRSY